MVYVIDSNILVTSRNIYFPVDENTGFWEWLIMLAREGDLIVPEKVYEEMGKGNDDIPDWLNQNKAILWRPTSSCRKELRLVIQAYESVWGVPDASQVDNLGADPYVIAHALMVNGTVVTNEVRSKSTTNVKIPNVCDLLSVPCISLPRFLWNLRDRMPVIITG